MNNIIYLVFIYFIFSIQHIYASSVDDYLQDHNVEWKVGVAEIVITPEFPMWMAGYSSRDRPANETRHDLRAKAIVLEDKSGQQVVFVSADLRNFPKNISGRIRDSIELQYSLSKAQIILNGTHTHSGPLLNTVRNYPYYISTLDSEEREKVVQYSEKLVDSVIEVVEEAFQSLEPAYLYAENGVSRFAVNRRNNPSWQNVAAKVPLNEVTELAGPVDHAVPVIKVENGAGDIIAIIFGYACHPTATPVEEYKWSGDWPGYAQLQLEKMYPNATALFFLGAAGDIDPMPRQTMAVAEQYGREMAAAVERVLNEDMRPLRSRLSTAYSEVELKLNTPPNREELSLMVSEFSGGQKRWATFLLNKINDGESLRTSYPYPVQIWMLGEQPIVSLGGELVVDYAIEIKRIFGQHTFVMGYANDVMSYIPTVRILREGGYEGAHSQMVRAMPNTWKPDIGIKILEEILGLAEKTGLSQLESPLNRN